jgi:Protein of unknown function (DUF3099)
LRRRSGKAVLITDAPPSVEGERRRREIRYVAMMSFRAICVVVAAILAGLHVGAAWLWAPACLTGMIVLPWFAVQTANEPDRRRNRVARSARRDAVGPDQLAVSARPDPLVIDAEAVR